jgi:hypothetical protein
MSVQMGIKTAQRGIDRDSTRILLENLENQLFWHGNSDSLGAAPMEDSFEGEVYEQPDLRAESDDDDYDYQSEHEHENEQESDHEYEHEFEPEYGDEGQAVALELQGIDGDITLQDGHRHIVDHNNHWMHEGQARHTARFDEYDGYGGAVLQNPEPYRTHRAIYSGDRCGYGLLDSQVGDHGGTNGQWSYPGQFRQTETHRSDEVPRLLPRTTQRHRHLAAHLLPQRHISDETHDPQDREMWEDQDMRDHNAGFY